MNPANNFTYLHYLIIFMMCTLTASTSSVNEIAGFQFWGTYNKITEGQNFDYLDSSTGQMIAIFYGSPDRYIINSVDIYLLDPKYYDQKLIILQIRGLLELNNTKDNKWTNESHSVIYTPCWRERNDESVNSDHVNSTISFINVDSEDIGQIQISIRMTGPNFGFEAELFYKSQGLNSLLYVAYVSAIIIVQIFCGTRLVRIYGNNQVLLGKMSQVTIGMSSIIDFTYAINFIQIMMGSQGGLLWFALPSISFLILFVLCDMKLMFLIWKSRNMGDIQNQDILRKRLTTFYITFYLGLFLYLTLQYFFSNDQLFIIMSNLLILPQIIHNIRLGARPFFNNYYVFGYLGTRILFPLYDRTCPQNYFKKRQDLTVVLILLAIYSTSILLLYLQNRLGSRFFLPKKFITSHYQYLIKIKLSQEYQNEECSICLQHIFCKDFSHVQIQNQSLDEEMLQEATVMKTPCQHLFHEDCLNSWMDVKLQCPKCRSKLPMQ